MLVSENVASAFHDFIICDYSFPLEAFSLLPKVLSHLKKLKCFYIKVQRMENEILQEIFKHLQPCYKTLKTIKILRENNDKELQSCCELFELLRKCEILAVMNITMSLIEFHICCQY